MAGETTSDLTILDSPDPEPTTGEPTDPDPETREPTIIQTSSGESYLTRSESPNEALARLSRDFVTQRLGNVVRIVRPRRSWARDRSRH